MAGLQTRGSRTAGKANTGDSSELPSDARARRSAANQRDAPLERAYNAGRRGDDPAEYQTSDELYGYYQDGAKAAKAEGRQARGDQLRGQAAGKAGSAASDGAGFLLGLIGYALLANYLRGGRSAVRAWLAAKFLNRTHDTAGVARPNQPTPNTAQPAQPAQAFRVGS